MKTLHLAAAAASPDLAGRLHRGHAQSIAIVSTAGRSPVLHPDGLQGYSPVLAVVRQASLAAVPSVEKPAYLVPLLAGLAAVVLLGGGGLAYWTHLKNEARQRIEALGLPTDGVGLRVAIRRGHPELIGAYSRLGVALSDTEGVIESAIESGDATAVATVLSGGARFAHEPNAAQFVELAIGSGDPQVLAALLAGGVKPEDPTFGGPQSLAQRAAMASQWNVLRWVIENRPKDADFADPQGNRLAHYIAFSAVAELVPLAHDRWGVDFTHATANNGAAPLHVAASHKAAAMVTALLAQGCDPLYETSTLMTPLAVAVRSGDDATIAAFVTTPPVVERLLADPGLTTLVDQGLTETVTALVAHGGLNANTVLDNRVSLLGEAVAKRQEALVAALLEHGADANQTFVYSNIEGVTPLMIAAVQGMPSSVKALLDHGASKTATAQNGFSVTLGAQRGGNSEVQALLGIGE